MRIHNDTLLGSYILPEKLIASLFLNFLNNILLDFLKRISLLYNQYI